MQARLKTCKESVVELLFRQDSTCRFVEFREGGVSSPLGIHVCVKHYRAVHADAKKKCYLCKIISLKCYDK